MSNLEKLRDAADDLEAAVYTLELRAGVSDREQEAQDIAEARIRARRVLELLLNFRAAKGGKGA
ncbi:hypothetical protein OH491_13650 [Termitidicoccus mucosus]|uniref:Uncharacterized protein n=1 Tax=Termitidicoccus mucosus TaxID=1184151 RepID=A0A178IH41_9BACT|nr:hypothetical protein AW736_13800 [Opitutaceae bacterium TSB47]